MHPPISRRDFFALGGGAALAAALAACGTDTGRDGAGSLTQWYHQYGEAGVQQAVRSYAADYGKTAGTQVDVVWTTGDYDRKASAALTREGGPDVLEFANGPTIDQIKAEQVVGLTDLLGSTTSDFNTQILDRLTYRGVVYAIPQVIDMQLLVYRKSLLRRAGVAVPGTVDELVAAAKTLTTADRKGLFVGNDGGATVLAGPALWSAGLDYLTPAGAVGFDSPLAATSLAKLRALFVSDSLLLGAPTDWSDPSAIVQGLTAMQWTGLWNIPTLQKAFGDDLGVAPYPRLSAAQGAPSVPIGAYGSGVNAKGKQIAAAKAYVKWLWVDNTTAQLDFAQSYGFHIPARNSLVPKAAGLQSGAGKQAADFVRQYGKPQTPLLWTPACQTAYQDAITSVITDGADPATELRAVVTKANQELARIGN